MFTVVTRRKKSRLLSSRFVGLSVAAHLAVALAAASATGDPPPPPERTSDTIYSTIQDEKPKPPQPKPPEPEMVRTTRPPTTGQNVQLHTPTRVPDRITDEPVGTDSVPADDGTGTAGQRIGDPPADPGPAQPPPDGPYGGVWDAPAVEVQPSLANRSEVARLLVRNYPRILADAGVAGRTLVELIIEPDGRVRPGSARIVETTHDQFADATLRMVERLRFRPAMVNDQPVPVLVQIPIDWQAPH